MNILAFGGSTSSTSINRSFASFASSLFDADFIEILDLNDFNMPIFNVDIEKVSGQPSPANKFLEKIAQADLLIVSLAEHNGSYSAAFKNILDWASRVQGNIFQDKPMLLMATSPGARGGKSVLEQATIRFPFHGAQILGTFSLPEFYKNFDIENGIINPEIMVQFEDIISQVKTFFN